MWKVWALSGDYQVGNQRMPWLMRACTWYRHCWSRALSVSCGISQHAPRSRLPFIRIIGLDWSPPIPPPPFLFRWRWWGRWFLHSSLWCSARGRNIVKRERGRRYDYPPSVDTKRRKAGSPAEQENEWLWPHQNLRKHLHLLIKIESGEVISVQGWPSSGRQSATSLWGFFSAGREQTSATPDWRMVDLHNNAHFPVTPVIPAASLSS